MESFLFEKEQLGLTVHELQRPFEDRFFEPDYRELQAKARAVWDQSPERVLEVEDLGNTARVITSGPGGVRSRTRYHLRRSAISWRISELAWECFACRGTGKKGDRTCHICRGGGWNDPLKEDG